MNGQWLKIRLPDGTEAYTAAWLLRVATALDDEPPTNEGDTPSRPAAPVKASSGLLGMNLDIDHPQGHPDPAAMNGIGWMRIKFNVSFNPANNSHGNKDIEAAYQRYLPFLEKYANAGMRVLMVFTHQLYGEGAGFNWTQMDSGRWQQLVPTYADFARQVAQRFNGIGPGSCLPDLERAGYQAGPCPRRRADPGRSIMAICSPRRSAPSVVLTKPRRLSPAATPPVRVRARICPGNAGPYADRNAA